MLKKADLDNFQEEIKKARVANKAQVILPATTPLNKFTYYVADGLHRLAGAKANIDKKTVDGTEYVLRNGNEIPIQVCGRCSSR